MNGAHAAAAPNDVAERYLARIEAHLVRLAEGHDPMGHLFGIERLARAARAEWQEAQRQSEHRRPKP
jgi:hypothetical protein